MSSSWFRWQKLETHHSTWTIRSWWGQMGSTRGCWGNWQKWFPSHFPPSVSVPGQPGRSQRIGVLPMWLPSTRKVVRRIWGTSGLSGWPQCQGRLWNRSSWVRSYSMCGITGGLGPASKGSWKAGAAWPICSPSTVEWFAWWRREKLLT